MAAGRALSNTGPIGSQHTFALRDITLSSSLQTGFCFLRPPLSADPSMYFATHLLSLLRGTIGLTLFRFNDRMG